MSKICKSCGEAKSENDFSKHSITKDGLAYECKKCVARQHKDSSEYYTAKSIEWREKNFEKWLCNTNRSKIKSSVKAIFEKCKSGAANRKYKIISTDLNGLKYYFEKYLNEYYSWNNFGEKWTFDFIIPLNKFDLTLPEEKLKASHFTNLKLKDV